MQREKTMGYKELDIKQDTDEWRDARRKYLTASDIPKIEAFLREESYYTTTSTMWFNQKMGEEAYFTDYQKDAMRKGQLCEASVVAQLFSDKEKYKHGEVFVSDCGNFLVSLDIRNCIKNSIIEIKSSENPRVINEYENLSHGAFFQLAMQMHVTKSKNGCILACLLGTENNPIIKPITTESPQYIWIEENIDLLKEINADLQKGINWFAERQGDIEIDESIQKIVLAYESAKAEIAKQKILMDIYKEELLSKLDGEEGYAKLGGEMYKYSGTSKRCKRNKLKPGIEASDVYDIEFGAEYITINKKKIS